MRKSQTIDIGDLVAWDGDVWIIIPSTREKKNGLDAMIICANDPKRLSIYFSLRSANDVIRAKQRGGLQFTLINSCRESK